jgi:hypothetical protein
MTLALIVSAVKEAVLDTLSPHQQVLSGSLIKAKSELNFKIFKFKKHFNEVETITLLSEMMTAVQLGH